MPRLVICTTCGRGHDQGTDCPDQPPCIWRCSGRTRSGPDKLDQARINKYDAQRSKP